jgi:CRISPR-associated endonuclease/helicase Cas3
MEDILDRHIEWLGAHGAPVILLSATLPATRRRSLAQAYQRGLGVGPAAPESEAKLAVYPLVTTVSRDSVSSIPAARVGASRHVTVQRLQTSEPRDVLPFLLDAVGAGATVAWIRNTVREATEAYQFLAEGAIPCRLFHARFRPTDRQVIETAVLRDYGRERGQGGPLLVATQVVEQSLDVDFDLLVSDLAPIDLLVQRIGRLHRHNRPRPPSFESPRLIIVEPSEEATQRLVFGPSAFVYDPVTLWLASDSLRDRGTVVLPDHLRELVEDTYDPDRRRERINRATNSSLLTAAEEKLTAEVAAREGRARSVCIPPTGVDPGAIHSFDDDEEGLRALTRDGDSASLILIAWDGAEGRSLDGDLWNPETADTWRLARDLASETISVPVYPWVRYICGVAPEGDSRWRRWEKQLQGVLTSVGMRSIVVPVVPDAGSWRGRVQTTRGIRLATYSRESGLVIHSEGADE